MNTTRTPNAPRSLKITRSLKTTRIWKTSRTLKTTFAALLLAMLSALLLAPDHGQRSVVDGGDFSSLVANNPKAYTVDNCRVEVGVVVDSRAYPNYAHVGGVRVNCSTYHSVIDATVALYYYNGSRWIQYGSSGYGVRYNQAGSGTGISGILRTPAYCVGGLRAYYWMVGATVRTERTGATVYSNLSADTAAGC